MQQITLDEWHVGKRPPKWWKVFSVYRCIYWRWSRTWAGLSWNGTHRWKTRTCSDKRLFHELWCVFLDWSQYRALVVGPLRNVGHWIQKENSRGDTKTRMRTRSWTLSRSQEETRSCEQTAEMNNHISQWPKVDCCALFAIKGGKVQLKGERNLVYALRRLVNNIILWPKADTRAGTHEKRQRWLHSLWWQQTRAATRGLSKRHENWVLSYERKEEKRKTNV